MKNLDNYPSVVLDNNEYAMIPMKSGIDLRDEVDRNQSEDINKTYGEQENCIIDNFRNEESYDFDDEDEYSEEYFDDDVRMEEKSFKPIFGVPLFIEERYMDDDEDGFRGKKHHHKGCHCNKNPQGIYMNIQRCHPEIFRAFRRYGVPCNEAKKIIMRIITLTLMCHDM